MSRDLRLLIDAAVSTRRSRRGRQRSASSNRPDTVHPDIMSDELDEVVEVITIITDVHGSMDPDNEDDCG